jgi:small subunit ribosomal protein S17e
MGRIKSLMVKRAAKQLLEESTASLFSQDFNINKKVLRNTMPSKSTRNKIAGYISRLMRAKAEKQKAEELKQKELEAKQAQIQA